jgi:hypothetical protein
MDKRKEQIERLKNLPDSKINFSDMPEIAEFSGWKPNPFFKPCKRTIKRKN